MEVSLFGEKSNTETGKAIWQWEGGFDNQWLLTIIFTAPYSSLYNVKGSQNFITFGKKSNTVPNNAIWW